MEKTAKSRVWRYNYGQWCCVKDLRFEDKEKDLWSEDKDLKSKDKDKNL